MSKIPYFLGLGVALTLPWVAAGCGGNPQARSPSEIGAPQTAAPAEPDLIAMVIGTEGRDHLTKDGYPLTKIADIIEVFKPDLLLLQVRAEPFKKQNLEDASFEMTYVNAVAGQAGVDTEPFDWFRDEDVLPPAIAGLGDSSAAPASTPKKGKKGDKGPEMKSVQAATADAKANSGKEVPDPFNYMTPPDIDADMGDAYKSETAMLNPLAPMTFVEANSDATSLKIWDAMSARIRYAKGYSPLARRVAWMNYNSTQMFNKQKGQVHRLIVVVNVRYRAAMEQMVAGFGAVLRDPVAVAKSAEQQHDSIPENVVNEWNHQIDRLKEDVPKHGPESVRQNILERIAILEAAVHKKGVCCVEASTLGPNDL